MKHRDKIIELSNQGKTRVEICKILNCTKSVVCYHLTKGQKEKYTHRRIKRRNIIHPLIRKIESFKDSRCGVAVKPTTQPLKAIYLKIHSFSRDRKNPNMKNNPCFTVEEGFQKLKENPVCYLTGTPIDLMEPSTYSLDHIIPTSRGGDNSLGNMGLCIKQVNMAKSDLLVDEFLALCQKVVDHLGK